MDYQDRILQCTDPAHADNVTDAGGDGSVTDFAFSAEEQAFYAEKGFNDPVRCADCRAAKKSRFNNQSRQMFSAVCADCGREDQVPFQPKGNKPVYCSDCFQQKRAMV